MLCQAPTYVVSEVTDASNVVFLLMPERGRTSCGGPFAISPDSIEAETETPELAGSEMDDGAPGRRAEAAIGDCWRPTWRSAGNDDLEAAESPVRRNKRWLEEGSGFWPRVNRNGDGALRGWE